MDFDCLLFFSTFVLSGFYRDDLIGAGGGESAVSRWIGTEPNLASRTLQFYFGNLFNFVLFFYV